MKCGGEGFGGWGGGRHAISEEGASAAGLNWGEEAKGDGIGLDGSIAGWTVFTLLPYSLSYL